MSPQLRAALRGLAIAAGVAVTLASLLAFRRADWPIYLTFVLLSLVLFRPYVEVLPNVVLPMPGIALTIGFVYLGGLPIILLRLVEPLAVRILRSILPVPWRAAVPPSVGGAVGVAALPWLRESRERLAVAAEWGVFSVGLVVRWWVVQLLVLGGAPASHPGSIAVAEVAGYAVWALLALVPIHTFHPFLAPAWSSKGKGLWPVIQDLELAFILALTPSVFLILYGYATNGIVGAVAWSLAALGLHVMLKRLTERRVAVEEQNRQLTALNHELEHRERLSAIGKTSSVVSHQILQQLGVIGLYADLIHNAADDDAPAERLEQARGNARAIEQALASVNGVLQDLLVFSRDQRLNTYEHALTSVVDEAIESCRHAAAERTVGLRADVPPDLRLSLDKLKIRQALANLLRNAIEASPIAAEVEVRATLEDGWVEVTVHDRGPGIAPAERHAVFTPFFTTKEQGTGLGLAIAREFARAHGGDLRLADVETPGATFVLRLPCGGTASPSDRGHAA
jgi:signal transduction histidine kinase